MARIRFTRSETGIDSQLRHSFDDASASLTVPACALMNEGRVDRTLRRRPVDQGQQLFTVARTPVVQPGREYKRQLGYVEGWQMWLWEKLRALQVEVDLIGIGSLLVSTYIALLLHRLSRKFSQNEATRSINEGWDAFHTAMLNKDVHDLFWRFMHGDKPFSGLGDRAHHVVLMYLNNVHTEYYTFQNRIFPNAHVNYLDKLLSVFIPKREQVVALAETSGYDRDFIDFLKVRLELLSKRPTEQST